MQQILEAIHLDRNEIISLNRHTGFIREEGRETVITLSLFGNKLLSYDQYLKRDEDVTKVISFLTQKIDTYKKEQEVLVNEILALREYGLALNPYDVLHEMYNGGKVSRGCDLIPYSKFKNRTFIEQDVRRWMTWLEANEIIKFDGQLRFAKYTWKIAKDLTREALKRERS